MVRLKLILFLFLEIIILFAILKTVFGIIKVLNLSFNGRKYLTKIQTDQLIFSTVSGNLKYFYEPKPDNSEIWKQDWLGTEIKNQINSDTLNDREYSADFKKTNETYRIITIGDSFTYGLYVDTYDSYPKVLESILNSHLSCKNISKFEVVNLGVYAYDIRYSVERFISRGKKYQPDLIVWLIYNWNMGRINELNMPLKTKLINEGIKEFNKDTQIHLIDIADSLINKEKGSDYILAYQREAIKTLKLSNPGRVLFVSDESLKKEYKMILNDFVNADLSFKYFDKFIDIFSDSRNYYVDSHPTAEGHKKIAEDIFKYLKKNYLTECN